MTQAERSGSKPCEPRALSGGRGEIEAEQEPNRRTTNQHRIHHNRHHLPKNLRRYEFRYTLRCHRRRSRNRSDPRHHPKNARPGVAAPSTSTSKNS